MHARVSEGSIVQRHQAASGFVVYGDFKQTLIAKPSFTLKRPDVEEKEAGFHKGLRCAGQPGCTNTCLRDQGKRL